MTSVQVSMLPKGDKHQYHHRVTGEVTTAEEKRRAVSFSEPLPPRDSCAAITRCVVQFLQLAAFLAFVLIIATLLCFHHTSIQNLDGRVRTLEKQLLEKKVCNKSEDGHPDRLRRAIQNQATNLWDDSGLGPNVMQAQNGESAHPFIHVTGIKQQTVRKDHEWFTWHTGDEAAYQDLSSTFLPFIGDKYVEIVQPGYYFIYSQAAYQDKQGDRIGHEVVKRPNCAQGTDLTLLQSSQWQIDSFQNLSPDDTGYSGGVFYLSTNDLVGVRPLQNSFRSTKRYVANHGAASYFGMFMLSADNHARVERPRNCQDVIPGF